MKIIGFVNNYSTGISQLSNTLDMCIQRQATGCIGYIEVVSKEDAIIYANEKCRELLDSIQEDEEEKIIINKAIEALSEAAIETMAIMGYNVIAKDGWVIKLFQDGTEEKIKQIK